jgi:hypothetical protein
MQPQGYAQFITFVTTGCGCTGATQPCSSLCVDTSGQCLTAANITNECQICINGLLSMGDMCAQDAVGNCTTSSDVCLAWYTCSKNCPPP